VYVKNILHPGARFGLIIAAVVLGAGEIGFAVGYALPYVLASLLAVGLFWRTLPKESDSQAAQQTFPELVRYSLPFTVSGLASFVYKSIDIFLLLYIVGNQAVGAYGVAYALARLIAMFSTAFGFLSTPISSQLENDNRIEEAVSVQTTIARWVTIITIGALVPMVVFASDFLRLIYRPAYASAGTTLAVLVIGFAIKNVLITHGPIIEALGRSKVAAFNTTAAAIVNLGANLVLIPRYGAFGAAVATTISFAVLSVLPMLEVKYFTGETTLSREALAPVLVAVPTTAISLPIFQVVPRTLLWTFGASGAFALSYGVAVIIILGFTPTDVMIVRSIEDKFGVSLGPFDAVLRRFS
jgi:O-antigen/teichoic acid export membrane protein